MRQLRKNLTVTITTLQIKKKQDSTVLFPTLIQVNKKNILVDCGYEEMFEEFVAALDSAGITTKDLYAIIVSHDDIDHLGALYQFKNANPDLIIYSSKIEEPSVSGKIKSERLEQAENSLANIPDEHKNWADDFIQQLKNIQRINVDLVLDDNDKIEEDIVVIHTPGHTKGHISLHIPSQSIVIANDAMVFEGDELNIANPAFTLDITAAVESVERIRDLRPAKLICYHGGVLESMVDEKLEALVKKYKTFQTA